MFYKPPSWDPGLWGRGALAPRCERADRGEQDAPGGGLRRAAGRLPRLWTQPKPGTRPSPGAYPPSRWPASRSQPCRPPAVALWMCSAFSLPPPPQGLALSLFDLQIAFQCHRLSEASSDPCRLEPDPLATFYTHRYLQHNLNAFWSLDE